MSLTTRILVAMGLGIILGSLVNLSLGMGWLAGEFSLKIVNSFVYDFLDAIGRVFIASLKLLVVPLVFVSLICGMTALGDNARMGAIAAKTLGLYMLTTALAISLALSLALLIGPGAGAESLNTVDFVAGDAGRRIADFFRDLEQVVMRMVGVLMQLAPYGVFCLLAKLFSELGFQAILDLGKYFLTVVLVLLLHALGVYSLLLKVISGLNPRVLYTKMRSVWAFAFSTASSGATLPITLRTVEKRLGVDTSVASFTVPLGATINMDGTAIMQGVATVFIAQVYGFDLGAGALLTVILTATLASIGTAAVPGVGLVTLALVLQQVGLPVEGIALIIGVDRLLDMLRTAVNVTGDATVSVIVAHSEGQLDQAEFFDPGAGADERETAAA